MRARDSVTDYVAILLLLIAVTALAAEPALAGQAETPSDPPPAADPGGEAIEDGIAGESSARDESDAPGRDQGCKGSRCCGGAEKGSGQGGCRRSRAEGEAGQGRGGGCGKGRQQGRGGQGHGAGRGGGGGKPEAVNAHNLLDAREGIQRRVEEIPGGVRTTTVAADPESLTLLERHVRDVEAMLAGEGHIRMWDPLYAEIFEHRERIEISVREIEGGFEVTETSTDPWVTELIRAHATKMVEFVYRGWDAYHEPTPLPERPDPSATAAPEVTP